MTGLEFLSATVGQLVWPLLVLLLLFMHRGQIRAVASSPRLARLKAGPGGVELEFREELSEAEKELESGGGLKAIEAAPTDRAEASDFISEMMRLAEVSPRSVVLETHARLEKLLRQSVEIPAGSRPAKYLSMRGLTRAALKQNLLATSEASVMDELTFLRNRVAHEPDHAITAADALRYADLGTQVAMSIRLARGQTTEDGAAL